MIESIAPILVATLVAGTPLVYAALGELVAEKSGILNLGVEGMMLVGAITAFATTLASGSVWLGIAAATLVGMGMAFIFAILAITLEANQVASGLALSIFGAGLSAFVGKSYVGVAFVNDSPPAHALLSGIPLIGSVINAFHPLVYLSWLLFAGLAWFLDKSRAGLVLRAVGESPATAYALGYRVNRIRYLATLFGGAMAGIAGAYLAVVYTSLWTEGMTAGRGWIALALVVFATWRPARVLFGAYLFGGVTTAQLFAQSAGLAVPPELMSSLPYLATIMVLVLISRKKSLIRLNTPMALGKPFQAER